MLSMFNQVDWHKIGRCIFITLTYPNFCRPDDHEDMSKHLHLFRRKLEKHLERKVPIVWRLEWEVRKTGPMRNFWYPHFHLMIVGVTFVHYARVNKWWREVIGHLPKTRTETRGAKDRTRCFIYITKYCAKRIGSLVFGPYLNNPWNGRRWGVLRRELLPFHDEHSMREADWTHITDLYDYCLSKRSALNEYGNRSFTLLGDQAEEIGNFLFGLTIDGEIIEV